MTRITDLPELVAAMQAGGTLTGLAVGGRHVSSLLDAVIEDDGETVARVTEAATERLLTAAACGDLRLHTTRSRATSRGAARDRYRLVSVAALDLGRVPAAGAVANPLTLAA